MFMNLVSWPTLAFLCFMVGLAGFVDASAGGGGLISLPAYMVTGLPVHLLYGANKFSSACGTTFASAMFFRSGALDLQVALIAAAASFAGSTLGSRLVLLLPGEVLKIMVLVMLPIAALIIFTQRKLPEEDRSSQVPRKKALALAAVIGLLIGLYDGLVGPGTGTFAIIAFTSVLKFDLRTASGNAKVLNLASNYASLITYIGAGNVPFALAIPCAVCNILGAILGSHFALSKGGKFIRPMLLVVLVLLLGKMAMDLLG